MRTGLLALGRPTFDVDFANETLAAMLTALAEAGIDYQGPQELLLDAESARAAVEDFEKNGIDRLLVLQVTFTDASLIVEAARTVDCPLSIWAPPEPRTGGRLRLNAFCGLNLASHALGVNGKPFGWLYRSPADVTADDLRQLLSGLTDGEAPRPVPPGEPDETGWAIAQAVNGRRIARVGAHPDGFHTCAYDPIALSKLAGVSVDELELGTLFEGAKAAPAADAERLRAEAARELEGLDAVDEEELDRSLRLKLALDDLRRTGKYDAFAIRCWPETFTDYGGAVCGPVSMLGEARVPCACEADVYGALTQLVLQEAAQAPVFLTDIVDVDIGDDSTVVWHCGQAPLSMARQDRAPEATVHTNRKMPLLYQFTLKPGPVTLMRISQAASEPKMILAVGDMLDRPMAFTGTSGVLRNAGGARRFLDGLIGARFEHHMALAYGDHRPALRSTAAALGLPVLEL